MKSALRPFLSLLNATFRLGDELVFEKTSWVFQRHEQWAILGPNGSGKSLFADALRGRLPLVQGELRYHFRPPTRLSAEESIGHVSFEDRKSEVHETVVQSRWNSLEGEHGLLARDFLSYERVMDLNPFEVTDQHTKARPQFELRRRRAVGLLRIEPLLARRLLSLSNGETQRVQLARALCHPLRLLILDEPFAGLDANNCQHFRGVLARLMKTPLRVLLITARIEDIPRGVTHLLRLDKCRVAAAGPRGETLARADNILSGLNERTVNRIRIAAFPSPRPSPLGRGGTAGGRLRIPVAPNSRTPSQRSSLSPRERAGVRGNNTAEREIRHTPDRIHKDSAEPGLIELRNVTVRYGAAIILRDLNWTVRAGESWALLGPNGSGKTTLLSLLLGDNPQAYSNHVRVFGQQRGSGDSVWELKKRIGWVSPELHLHFNEAATCFEVVASGFHETIGLFEPPTARQRAAVRQWLAKFGLRKFAATPLFALSAGLQRLVLLARALVKRPQLLLLDEPCQNLDAAHRARFVEMVDALIRRGAVTAIYVTHREDEIPPAITRVLRLPF
ncbi:MAG TPA: ATP-binding cassette domain-containing protein [Candidatus Binatia bacterium]|jgi:molybdate transport system ATP-binding protein|nr:ATP-binding cassette domain-containing protein [Candidatus Binatia bacterium]